MTKRKRTRRVQTAPGVYFKNGYRLAIRDTRLSRGRLDRSLRTDDAVTANQRAAAVRFLLDRAEYEIIDLWGRGEIHIADIEAAVREMDLDRVRRMNAGALTLGEEADRLLQVVKSSSEPRTYLQYQSALKMLRARFGDDTPLADITEDMAQEWLSEDKASTGHKPWAAKTQHLYCMVAGRLWKEAIDREIALAERTRSRPRITRNPWKAVTLPRVRQTRAGFLQPEEWRQVLRKAAGRPEAGFVAVCALAGLRMQEAANLRTGIDVDLERRVLHIQPREGEFRWRPKTDRSIRDIPMSEDLHRVLSDHVRAGYAGERYFFRTARNDRPVSRHTLQTWVRRTFERAGIKYGIKGDGLTCHSLRHTFASWLLLRRVPVHVVAKLMGDTVEIVLRTYAHLLRENLEEAVRELDLMTTEAE